nr:DUF3883 domain-containing protein [Lysobacter tabacisoli]
MVVGGTYSREGIALVGGVTAPVGPRDPHWASGIVRFDNALLLLVTLVKPQTYRDYFDGPLFWWQSQTRQSQKSPVIRRLASGELPAHLFVRVREKVRGKTQPFVYCGQLSAPELEGELPVTALFEVVNYVPSATGALGEVYAWHPDSPPAAAEDERREAIVRRRGGGGQGRQSDTELRRALELYAMQHATAHYLEAGYEVEDTSANRPYDLECRREGVYRRVEVKATQSAGESVLLTIGEVNAARDPGSTTDLYILYGISVARELGRPVLSRGTVKLIEDWLPNDCDLSPTAFAYRTPRE